MITSRHVSSLFVLVLSFFLIAAGHAYSGPPPSLTDEETHISDTLISAHTEGNRFWTVFAENEEKLNRPVLEKVLDYAIGISDDRLIDMVLEGARKKNDEKALTEMMLRAADYFLFTSRTDRALKLYDAAMPLARLLEDDTLMARSYEGNGDGAFYQGSPTNALLMYNKAAEIYSRTGPAIHRGIIARKTADVYSQTGDGATAQKLIQASLLIISRERSPIEEGHVYRSMAYAAMRLRDYKTALGALEIALARYKGASYRAGEADVYRALGDIDLKTGESDQAAEHYRGALTLYKKTGFVVGEAYTLKGLADIAYFSGNNDEALETYQKALEMFRSADYPLGQADTLRRMGQLYLRRGNLNAVSEAYEAALPLYRKLKEPVGQADIYKGLGDVGYYNRNFSRALEMYDRALPLYVEANEPLGQGNVQRSLGDIYFYAGDYPRAMQYYENALRLYVRASSPLGQANTYRTMGEAYLRLKKMDHALAMFNSAMALYKKTREPIGQGDIYKTLGEIYLARGNKMGALDMFQEALRLLKAANSLVDMGHAYQGIGDVFFSAADLEKADENYNLALDLYGQMQDMESQGLTLLKKASVAGQRDDVKEAIRLYDAALAKFEQVRTRAAFSELKRSYMEKIYGHYEGAALYMLEKDQGEKALQYIEAMKARMFLDQLAEARADLEKGIDSQVKKERDLLENKILMLKKRLAEENQAKFPDKKVAEELKNDLSAAQEKLDALAREIRYKNPLYASVEYPQPISAKALQENILRDNEVLLEYFLAKKGVYCLVIGKNEFNVVKLPAKYEDITARVQKMLGNVRGHQQGERFRDDLARELYDALVKPAEEYIDGKTLIIAPQGILAYLPFEALVTEKDGDKIFMVEKYPMTYIQSGTVLGVLRSQHSTDNTRGGFVGFGDPVYDFQEYVKEAEAGKKETETTEGKGGPAGDKKEEQVKDFSPGAVFMKNTYLRSGGTLTRLKGTAEEIEAINSMYEKTGARHQKYLRIDASEEKAKSPEMGQYSYIHFSTHGILQTGFQAIALSQIPSDKEDGFLTLGEIMNTRFNARLVVLSACETGLGDLSNAEGVTGLTRAVMYAGSPAALVSLWSVADEPTRDLMTTFYDGLISKGLSKLDALRSAKISMIKDTKPRAFKHPYFWSAFVMYGE
jgi:CHAT domain-containing protein/uncharacterized protein HemY